MIKKIEQPIQTYFTSTSDSDKRAFLSIFSEDAVVFDEGREFRGLTKITEWSEQYHFASKLKLEVINIREESPQTIITAKVDGDFDKTGLPDPLLLDFHFTVVNEKVTRLEILLA
ncbi:MAG: nuclear transport factor 2 family protein [Clostridia bacterium]|jgi:ketosteroid isomerase-like protein|nr:nuclear transport factor 2 family protein [Clostridia bacterium]